MAKSRKERVFVIFDGSNFYHRLKEPPFKFGNLLEFNFRRFVKFVLKSRRLIKVCYYVGAVRAEEGNSKSFALLRAQHRLFSHLTKDKIDIFRGYILKNGGYHEKGVDVKMAVDLLVGAYENLWDTAVILSSDTDLLPAIFKAKLLGKRIEYLGFSHRPSRAMINQATRSKLLTPGEVLPFVKK